MAMITYGALAAKLRTNAADVAAAGTMSPVTEANITALAELLDLMAAKKSMGQPPLIACSDATKAQLNSAS